MTGIYKITNKINGKSYIGQSVDIARRWRSHKQALRNPNIRSYHPLYIDMFQFGLDQFEFEILEECKKSDLDDKEKYYISMYHSYGQDGYNRNKGGKDASNYIKLSDELVLEIIECLKHSSENSEIIGKKFNVSGRTIRSINSGECCKVATETYPIRAHLCEKQHWQCERCGENITKHAKLCWNCYCMKKRSESIRPTPFELARLVSEYGFRKTGDMFNVSDVAIKKWCKSYKIPYRKKELVNWYFENKLETDNNADN